MPDGLPAGGTLQEWEGEGRGAEGDARRKVLGERGERPVRAPFPVGWIEEGEGRIRAALWGQGGTGTRRGWGGTVSDGAGGGRDRA